MYLELNDRFRVEGQADAGLLQHRQVVGTVADGQGLLQRDALSGGHLLDEGGLPFGVDDGPDEFSGQDGTVVADDELSIHGFGSAET